MKVAILHDYFDKKGGGERLMLNLARKLKADIYTGFIDKKMTFDTKGIKIISLDISKKLPQLLRNIKIAKKFENYKFPKYDVYIFSGVWCISAARNNHPNILYCHTPPRYLYDLKDYFIEQSGIVQKGIFKKFIKYWKKKDRKYMENFDIICPNSNNVKKRILKFYGTEIYRKCKVVYPGIETKKFIYKKHENYFLSTSRLDKLKRIDMIIEAFIKIPDKKLIIVGKGPDKKSLQKISQNYDNIKFVGSVPEKELIDLYARCKATIASAIDEDFGMVSVESQAAGKPVIAVKEGGFLETVNKKTGVFFEPNSESLVNAIKKCEKIKWNYKLIQKNAKKYDIKLFAKKMERLCKSVV